MKNEPVMIAGAVTALASAILIRFTMDALGPEIVSATVALIALLANFAARRLVTPLARLKA